MTNPAITGLRGMVTGLFRDRASAERAFECVSARGYEGSDINLVMSEDTRQRYFSTPARTELADKASEATPDSGGDVLGGPVGGTVSTIAPVVAAVGTLLLIPGIVMAGPVAIAIAAAGAVGLAGGLIGALADWGVPAERLRQYEQGIRDGGILMGIKPRSPQDAEYIENQWRKLGGELVHS